MAARRVAVIGAGVIGLSVAAELAEQGSEVTVFADAPGPLDCSPVAGAVWFPYAVGLDPALLAASEATRRRFEALADVSGTGVAMRRGSYIVRRGDVDMRWSDRLPGRRDLRAHELPEGALRGIRVTLPVIDMSIYLAWLTRRVEAAGTAVERRRIMRLDELRAAPRRFDAIVVAAGLRSAELVADDEPLVPLRGQVVRLRNPGLSEWWIDEDAPDGLTYVIPRFDDVVCGGTNEAGSTDPEPDAGTEAEILRRARAIAPELEGMPVTSRGVGFRPGRSAPRIGWADRRGGVLACYGHGGAGVSLSWGSAAAVRAALSTPEC